MMEVDFPSRNPYLESDYIAGRMENSKTRDRESKFETREQRVKGF